MIALIQFLIDLIVDGFKFIVSCITFIQNVIRYMPLYFRTIYPYGTIIPVCIAVLSIKLILRKGE